MEQRRSGYVGVHWHQGAGKWTTSIRINGVHRYLGLFDSAETAHAAYLQAKALKDSAKPQLNAEGMRHAIIAEIRSFYEEHGIVALSVPFLEERRLYHRMRRLGIRQPDAVAALGLQAEYSQWRESARTYRGSTKPKWSWKVAVDVAKRVTEQQGDLPTLDWFRTNGYHGVVSAVYKSKHTWEDLRDAVGCRSNESFCRSRNGMRWRSRPEASLSNFLYARGIEHKRGERYPPDYAAQSGRLYGSYDLHFRSFDGSWVDVEVWGDPINNLSGGRYQQTRRLKEKYHTDNKRFLGISYRDCLSDSRLAEILRPYIGVRQPARFDTEFDHIIETSHWSDADDLLRSCREFAARMPDGNFPSESWLRKRGKYVDRPGPTHNTLAVRINQWLGGIRKLRRILAQSHVSTNEWSVERVVSEWRAFSERYGLTPSQCKSAIRRVELSPETLRQAYRLYEAARRLGVLGQARAGSTARAIKWTPTTAIAEWVQFYNDHGKTPTQCMVAGRNGNLPTSIYHDATRIYGAVRRLGVLDMARRATKKTGGPG